MGNKILKWLILLALILLIVSFISFWFGGSSFSEGNVKLEVQGPMQASAGDEAVYKIKYTNNNKIDLTGLSFKFTYPDSSVVIKDGKVQSDLTESFTLDKLPAGQSGEKEFRAFLVGDRGNIKNAKIDLTYKAGDLKTIFTQNAAISTTIVTLPVSLTLAAPPNSVSGQSISYVLDYRNESGNDISDLRFEFAYPDGFVPQSFTPSPAESKNVWTVPLLKKNSGGRITIQGVLAGKENEAKIISVVLKRKISDLSAQTGQYINYENSSASSVIASPLLGADILVNDLHDYTAHAGDDLDYVIKYSNNSNYNLSGLTLSVKLDGDMFDFSKLNTRGGFYDNSSNTILWDPSVVSDFANMPPNAKGQVEFTVNLKPNISSGISSSKNLFVKASVRLNTPNVPPGVSGEELFTTASIITKVTTQPIFNQLIYYSDGAFGSSGPFPPQVGKETVLTVHWQTINPGNDIGNANIRGVLPAGVNWKNVTSVGAGQPELIFNKNTSEVVWNLGTLSQGVGVSLPKYEVSFQIGVKPSSIQTGAPILLIKNTNLSGTDNFTKQSIVVPVNDMTTNDLTDRLGEGYVK